MATIPAMGTALPSVMSSSSISTIGQPASTTPGCSSRPMKTKNTVANSSRSGTISPSTLAARSDSARARPATKAPSATDTPTALASGGGSDRDHRHGHDEQLPRTAGAAMRPSSAGSSREPTTSTAATKPRAMALDRMAPTNGSSAGAATAESSTTSTTVSRSCTIDHDRAIRPCSVASRARSPATLASTTLEQTLTEAPMNSAAMNGIPSSTLVPMPSAMVIATWSGAPIRTSRPTCHSSAMRNWMPMLNMSSATPMSARACTSS